MYSYRTIAIKHSLNQSHSQKSSTFGSLFLTILYSPTCTWWPPLHGHNDDSDGLHLPAGQHLLVDVKDVDSEFLNSEERLASAMIDLTNE